MDKTYSAQNMSDGHVAVPVSQQFINSYSLQSDHHCFKDVEFRLSSVNLRKQSRCKSRGALLSAVKSLCLNRSLWNDDLESDLPRTWEKHGDMLLLPSDCFLFDVWKLLGTSSSRLKDCVLVGSVLVGSGDIQHCVML